jgi:hypothetical protein
VKNAERRKETAVEAASERRGLACPRCECWHLRVIYTRRTAGGRFMRRRECRHCGKRVTTYEHSIG